jgi:hypothetical protein
MVKCPNCGKEANDDPYCSNCGTKIEQKSVCPQCNSEVDEESAFCPKCGTKLKDDSAAEEQVNEEKVEEEKKDIADEEKVEEKTDEEPKEDNEIKTEEKFSYVEKQYCPFCNSELDEGTIFCQECGKPVEIDKQSFAGIKNTINFKNLLIWTVISVIIAIFISLMFCYILGSTGKYYEVGFIISLIICVGIFGSFKDVVNGGLLGIITGLVLGILSESIIAISNGFSYGYDMLFGYSAIVFTIVGLIIGIISSKYLRGHIKEKIDVEKLFNS